MNLTDIRIKRILYATDLSETAVHAFSYAVSLATLYNAGITILHVLTEFPGEQFISNMISTDTWEESKRRHYSEAREQLIGKKTEHLAMGEVLQAFSDEVLTDTGDQAVESGDILIKRGATAETIVQTAQEQACDLIVMGTHGHGTITEVLVGSTAKWVVKHSPIPVLIIRLP